MSTKQSKSESQGKEKKRRGNPGTPRKYPPKVKTTDPDQIDFSAAVPKTQPGVTTQTPEDPTTNINNIILAGDVVSNENKFSIKSLITAKELNFLEYFLSGEYTIEEAMISAGYIGYHQKSLYRISRKIVEKYEEGARGAKEVMRKCGVGEVRVAKKIDGLMDDPSSRTQLGATELAGRILGMTQEQRGPTQGIQIIINTAPAAAHQGSQPGHPQVIDLTVEERKPLPPPSKPLQITK